MTSNQIKELLNQVKAGQIEVDQALDRLKDLPFEDVGFAKIDHHRELRTGFPEVIFCAGKTIPQILQIIEMMCSNNSNVLATRANCEVFDAVSPKFPKAKYNEAARAISIIQKPVEAPSSYIAVVTAGTADIPVAEEAAVTAEIFGNKVERVFDVGVAGIHRLFSRLDVIRGAKVVVAVAGMEGALASVLGGLVSVPVIAVPTSIGYGASFQGLAPLLTMLNSCAAGVTVVNIDNGFGAGYNAAMINRL
jgi:NCAIR mutase (PurE)-related protein